MYKFQLLSDLHLEMGTYYNIKPKAPYLLLAGDIGYPESQIFKDFIKQCSKKFNKVFYTSGNHEYYQTKENKKSIEEIDSIIKNICNQYNNVFYLQNEYYDLDNNIRIVGSTLWSNVINTENLTNDYSYIYKSDKNNITINDTIEMFNNNKEYIQSIIQYSDKPIIIITHHLPSYKMILPKFELSEYKSYFASDLDNLFKYPIITWVCGHSHGFNKIFINNIPCIMNGLGYPSEPRYGASLNFTFEYNIE